MNVPFLDLRVTDQEEKTALLAAVERVLDHGRIILGPEVQQFENAMAAQIGRTHVVGVGSGTDADILALRALGLGPGDEVITTPLSFIATANAVRLVGATPVFADIDDDLNLDPQTIESLITPRTRAIFAVHWSGLVCRMDEIQAIAKKHGLLLAEDCAQAFGATRNGKCAGAWADVAAYSMNSMKGLASLGEAGAVATNDAGIRDRLHALRYNGVVDREFCYYVSHNGRLDTIQASMLLERLRRYPERLRARRDNAAYYERMLKGVRLFRVPLGCEHAYYTYTIRTDRRDELKRYLEANGIEGRVQHEPLMPDQPDYLAKYRGEFPNARRLIREVLCLPASEKVTAEQREYVVQKVNAFFS